MISAVKHFNAGKELFDEIIRIKSVAWDYSYDKQMEWIRNNIKPDDIHVILRENGYGVAYLNLIDISFSINGAGFSGYGIGNVSSFSKGLGYGMKLMENVNHLLVQNNNIGFLLCRRGLVDFYKKTGWHMIDKKNIFVDFDKSDIEFMIYNFDCIIYKFEYSGHLF